MDVAAIRAEMEALGPWHHDVELVPGLRTGEAPLGKRPLLQSRTPTTYDPEGHMRLIVAALWPDGMQGRSFLDCACNGGGHMLGAARLGAGRRFGFDAREQWTAQARFLQRFAPAPAGEVRTCTLADLPALGLEPFDVTLFSGIFYHLPDPVAGLRVAADLTRELLVLNTAALFGRGRAMVLKKESATQPMSGVDGLAWLPTGSGVLRQILAWCGFPHVRICFNKRTAEGWRRIELLAARESKTFAFYDSRGPSTPPGARLGLTRVLLRRMGLKGY
ncbi:MAG: DUF1698 domain-containing protein [Alphaproteobacteria bacterium]|nr:DUF1698 domain-containing protein [Alphaproteobacteria bacterium]MBV9370987.1 DUF1698 domain-containing protein [Alphaproteobacteria bacterium]MBV9899530.1 DUF1698 domain-containing protein [Alphaproteobacteria bacterium]